MADFTDWIIIHFMADEMRVGKGKGQMCAHELQVTISWALSVPSVQLLKFQGLGLSEVCLEQL